MSNFAQPFPSDNGSNGSRLRQRQSGDFRNAAANGVIAGANGNGPLPVPTNSQLRMGNGNNAGRSTNSGFEGARSPPNNKNTSHVPCKFFRQGACQAGKACPFSHSTEPASEVAPCKYFQKGNCKFGAKCALAHILPDGRRVNRPGFGYGGGHLNLGGRVHPPHHPDATRNNSLLTMQAQMAPVPLAPYSVPMQDEFFGAQGQPRTSYDMIPTIDTTFSSHPGSNYGSPPNDSRIPLSPVQKGLSVMDAPLPASFDSQGISNYARYGAIAASVPTRFGLEPSPPSSYQNKPIGDSSTLRNLHNSAFGDDSRNGKDLGSSPPTANEEYVGRRIMHSERFSSRPKMMSASLGARGDDWDGNFAFEEDLVPTALQDLLTPQEKLRRFSRTGDEFSGHGTPGDSSPKVGSPLTASPSRFGALFSRTRANEGSEAGSVPGTSIFGHVGSPLRNSSLHPGASPSLRAVSRPTSGDVSPFVSSPPRQSQGNLSMLARDLQKSRLNDSGTSLHPGMSRVASGSSVGSSMSGVGRAVSSSSFNRERIEEEQGLFSMEEEEDETELNATKKTLAPKRYSGGWFGLGKSSPSLGPIGGQRTASSNKDVSPNPWTKGAP